MKRLPIGVRLTLWYVAIFATAQGVFGGLMWVSLRHHLYEIVNDTLQDETEDLKSFLASQKKDASLAKMQEEVSETYQDEHSGEYLELYDQNGNQLYKSDKLKSMKPFREIQGKELYFDRQLGEKPVRFLMTTISVRDQTYYVRIGTPISEVHRTLTAFSRFLLMLAPALLALAAGVGYWLSRRALAPVDRLTEAARSIGGGSLNSRLEVQETGDELQRLAVTLNDMLERIEGTFRRVTEFTADASHELRTPVSLIRTEAEIALRRQRSSAEYRVSLEHILAESERTSRLLEQLLGLARADAGRELLEIREVDLGVVVEETAEAWAPAARYKKLTIRCDIPKTSIFVRGDRTALRRVIDALVDNAMKYAKENGTIEIVLHGDAGIAVVTVEDDGIGIPLEEQAKIFERFYRVDKARSRSQGGAGLGLAIAHWIVNQHRGTIRVESVQGKGSKFEVRLPELAIESVSRP